MGTYDIRLNVRVLDEQRLFDAALRHAVKVDNLDEPFARETLTYGDGSIDVEACLRMIFDPGESPSGTSINDSVVERIES